MTEPAIDNELKILSSEEQYSVYMWFVFCFFCFIEQLQLLNAFALTHTKLVCIFSGVGGCGGCFTAAHIAVIFECIIIAT